MADQIEELVKIEMKDGKRIITITLDEKDNPNVMCSESIFKGNPMFNMVYMGGRPITFSFGVGKAKMILYSLINLGEFYAKHKGKLDSND